MKKLKFAFCIFGWMLLSNGLNAQIVKLYPIDESNSDSSFQKFKDTFIKAINEKDSLYIMSILAEDVFTSFGGDGGKYEFSEMYLDPEKRSINFWIEAKEIMELGGTFSDLNGFKTFRAPYVSSRFPSDKVYDPNFPGDIVDVQIALKKNVKVYSEPNTASDVVATLSYDIVWANGNKNIWDKKARKSLWKFVKLSDNKSGYVFHKDVRTYTDYRLSFVKVGNLWVLSSFIAGD